MASGKRKPEQYFDDDDVEASDEEGEEPSDPEAGGEDDAGDDGANIDTDEPSEGGAADEDQPRKKRAKTSRNERREEKINVAEVGYMVAAGSNAEAALLQLQVEELLREARVDHGREHALNDALHKLQRLLAGLPPRQELSAADAAGWLAQLGLPAPSSSMPFHPPVHVTVVGSCASHTSSRAAPCIDVAMEMPQACFRTTKDPIDHRYHCRKVAYLAAVAQRLAGDKTFGRLELSTLHGDPRSPVLLIRPTLPSSSTSLSSSGGRQHAGGGGFSIRLLPCISPATFPLTRLAPDRNNVRSVCAPLPPGAAAPPDGSDVQLLPTPHYNATIAADALAVLVSKVTEEALRGQAALADGLLLLKLWCRRHGFSSAAAPDGLSGAAAAMLTVHLLDAGRVSPTMGPLQVLRAALQALSGGAGSLQKGIFVGRRLADAAPSCAALLASLPASPPPSEACFRQSYDVVLVEPSGWLNLTANVTRSMLFHVAVAAKATVAALDSGLDPEAAFASVFLNATPSAAAYDYLWHVQLPAPAAGGAAAGGGEERAESICKDRVLWREQEAQIEAVVKQALGDRARLVHVLRRPLPGAATDDAGGGGSGGSALQAFRQRGYVPPARHVTVGALMDAAAAGRLVDVGPPADDARAAAKFRKFWGAKAELRRFQDGKINEAVVWQAGPADRHSIPDQIVRYAAQQHLPAGTRVACCADALDGVLAPKHVEGGAAASVSAGWAADAALDKLSKQLRGLDGLALKVVGVQPLSPASRHTAPFPPLPHPLAGAGGGAASASAEELLGSGRLPRVLEPIEVLVQLEESGRWPSEPIAFSKMKAALGLQLATALETSYSHTVVASEACLEVLVGGFAFRLLLYSGRDEAMLLRESKAAATGAAVNGGGAKAATAGAAAAAGGGGAAAAAAASPSPLTSPEARPLIRSWHHGLIAQVAAEHPAYAPSVRLAQRWVACHMLSNSFPAEAVELLVAAAFTGPAPCLPPASRVTGLLRFLRLLATHPWQQQPLVVDPAKELTAAAASALRRAHSAARAAGAAPPLCLLTPKDPHSSHWTAQRPSAPVLQHASVLAARSAKALSKLLVPEGAAAYDAAGHVAEAAPAVWEQKLFCPALREFDVLILLRKEALPQADRALEAATRQLAALTGRRRRRGSSSSSAANAGGGGREAFASLLAAADAADEPPAPPKRSRAILRAFPSTIVASQGLAKLQQELLIGFDPVALFTTKLEERFGHLAVFCSDGLGGRAVGVKWRPDAFLPQPLASLRLATCHTAMPCATTAAAAGAVTAAKGSSGKKGSSGSSSSLSAVSVVPNVAHVVEEMAELGQGLVLDIVGAALSLGVVPNHPQPKSGTGR